VSVPDTDLLTELGLILQEDPVTWANGLWTFAEVLGYANQRQYRFLVETQILGSFATIGWIPGQAQMPLPADWITTIFMMLIVPPVKSSAITSRRRRSIGRSFR